MVYVIAPLSTLVLYGVLESLYHMNGSVLMFRSLKYEVIISLLIGAVVLAGALILESVETNGYGGHYVWRAVYAVTGVICLLIYKSSHFDEIQDSIDYAVVSLIPLGAAIVTSCWV